MIQPEERPKKHVSYEEIESALDKIKDVVRERYNSLYGIPRGGLFVALLLSHRTDNLPVLLHEKEIKEDTLVVDDIVDRGVTLERLFSRCAEFGSDQRCPDVFALYFRTDKFTFVFPAQDAGDEWIIFPWESEGSSRYDGTSL